jgi:hypothetical protein
VTDLRIGDRVMYQPVGADRPYIPCTVLDLRRASNGPGVFASGTVRARIRTGRGGWVNVERLHKITEQPQ